MVRGGFLFRSVMKDLNNNLYVYGDLECWGKIGLLGENSYIYNSGRMTDTHLSRK